ncbi:MAG TPA: hypothetical protein DD620_01980 [Verrucomicrobia bacterium]|nr:hypothetical protein [Verrucomicrobiota bacterium]
MNDNETILTSGSESRSALRSVAFKDVILEDSFWLPRLKTQKNTTLPFALEKTKIAVENLKKCGSYLRGNSSDLPFPHRFLSSDLYKVMEGAAYLLMIEKDQELEEKMDEIISTIERAQKDDGYLYVAHICNIAVEQEMGNQPYSYVLHSHELYNLGHLYEAAVAYYLATGKRSWLNIAEKSAKHVNDVFFKGHVNYNDGIPVNQAPGHQEIEIGLCKLYDVTGKNLYLEMARRFLDIRGVSFKLDENGTGVMSPEYAQQHKPVIKQEEAVGHAVRAGYMYAAMADVGVLMQDDVYDAVLNKIWTNLTDTKMHITGGLGAIHGIEGFGKPYDLPNKNAYNETCAAIANVLFNYRMFLRHKDAKYFDVAEIALLNNALAGVNLAGDRFFYVNPLEADGIKLFNHGNAGRAPWFDCACCPSNIARIMPQVGGYMYATDDDDIYCLLYASNTVRINLENRKINLRQETEYPFDGKIRLRVSLNEASEFGIRLRIPTWIEDQFLPGNLYSYCNKSESKWGISLNGEELYADLEKGFAVVRRRWNDGDLIELNLPMPIRYTKCSPEVIDNRNRLAITRGPLVYCAEEIDNAGEIQRFFLPPSAEKIYTDYYEIQEPPLKGMIGLSVAANKIVYESVDEENMNLIPYFAWNNRGNATMNVWFPCNKENAASSLHEVKYNKDKFGDIFVTSCSKDGDKEALSNGERPQHSADPTISKWISESNSQQNQLVEMKFKLAQRVESLGVYWADDNINVFVPKSWSLSYLKNGIWHPFELYVTDFFGINKDMYIVVHPSSTLVCDGLRLSIKPQINKQVGILDMDLDIRN